MTQNASGEQFDVIYLTLSTLGTAEPGGDPRLPVEQRLGLMCKAAREIIVVTDSSKLGRVCLHKILDTRGIARLVTDAGIGEATRAELARCGVEVIIA